MSLRDIRLLVGRELRSALRERSIVLQTFVAPVLLYPGIIWLVFTVQMLATGLTEQMPLRVALVNVPPAHAGLRAQVERDRRMVLHDVANTEAALRGDWLDAVLEFPPPSSTFGAPPPARLVMTAARPRSQMAAERLREHVEAWQDLRLERLSTTGGLSPAALQMVWVKPRNLTSDRQLGRFVLSIVLPVSLVLFLAIGGLNPALDTTAGERERATWETLLLTSASRFDIAIAKYAYVVIFSLASGLLNLVVILACVAAILAPVAGVTLDLAPGSLLIIVPGAVLLALFTSAGLMVLGAFARTFQQGQSLVSPFFLVVSLPAVVAADPGLTFTTPLAFVPVVNVALVFREAIAGRYPLPEIAVTVAVLVACVVGALWLASRLMAREDILLGTYAGNFWTFLQRGRRKS